MKTTVASFPGKIGDALLQWPVMYQWAKKTGKQFECWLDENSLKPLVPLFEAQPCVSKVKLIPGIKHWRLGGQPFDFGLTTEDHLEHEIYHMGFRRFPDRAITLQTLEALPFDLDRDALAQGPSLFVDRPYEGNRVVLHGTFQAHMTGVPNFWRFLNRVRPDLAQWFDQLVFVGTPAERERAMELYGKPTDERIKPVFPGEWRDFDDKGDFYELAKLVAGSTMVIGAGSCVVALAGALKIPSLRVHDPIGDAPRVIWSNLGPLQFNETERDLREIWPYILNQVRESRVLSSEVPS